MQLICLEQIILLLIFFKNISRMLHVAKLFQYILWYKNQYLMIIPCFNYMVPLFVELIF